METNLKACTKYWNEIWESECRKKKSKDHNTILNIVWDGQIRVRELEDKTHQAPDSAPDMYHLRLSSVNDEVEARIC